MLQQDGQTGKSKLLARSCLRILVQSLQVNASSTDQGTDRLNGPARRPGPAQGWVRQDDAALRELLASWHRLTFPSARYHGADPSVRIATTRKQSVDFRYVCHMMPNSPPIGLQARFWWPPQESGRAAVCIGSVLRSPGCLRRLSWGRSGPGFTGRTATSRTG